MKLEMLKRLTTEKLGLASKRDGAINFGIAGLRPFWYHHTTKLDASVYRPLVCVVLQGEKEMHFHERTVSLTSGTAIVVSQYLSVASRISEASSETPYLAVVVPLEIDRLRKLNDGAMYRPQEGQRPKTLRTFDLDTLFATTLQRILELTPGTAEASLLADIYCDELHARLLLSDAGDDLRALITENSRANRIALAITHIRDHLVVPCDIAELMALSGMSNSTLHEQFKLATGTSPLQFQKDLRLLEARSSLSSSPKPISQVAFDVGYTSPTQFAREYKRKFGTSPRQDRIVETTLLV
jgi:AraC-like DNA-binding protein